MFTSQSSLTVLWGHMQQMVFGLGQGLRDVCVRERERDLMDVLFCLALDGYLAGTGEVGDGGQEVLKADGWFFTPTFSPTLTNSCTSDRVRICP